MNVPISGLFFQCDYRPFDSALCVSRSQTSCLIDFHWSKNLFDHASFWLRSNLGLNSSWAAREGGRRCKENWKWFAVSMKAFIAFNQVNWGSASTQASVRQQVKTLIQDNWNRSGQTEWRAQNGSNTALTIWQEPVARGRIKYWGADERIESRCVGRWGSQVTERGRSKLGHVAWNNVQGKEKFALQSFLFT